MPPQPPPPHMHEDDGTVEGCPGCMYDIAHTDEPEIPADSPVVLAHVIAEAIRDLAEGIGEHEHHWDIQGVQPIPEPPVRLPMVASLTGTYALVKCVHCGQLDCWTLPGTWTLAELRADAFADERTEFLRELGAKPAAELTALLAPYRRVPAE